jgi:hypothetical protein
VGLGGKIMDLFLQPRMHCRCLAFRCRCGLHVWGGSGRRSLFFRCSIATVPDMRSDFIRHIIIERTGVRFLVVNANSHQEFDNDVALHFQFACQFVDPNLPHA